MPENPSNHASEHDPKPMYLHGREGDPCGSKGAYMQFKLSCGAHAPRMPATSRNPNAFDESYNIAKTTLLELQSQKNMPNIIVGSSFGGAVLMKLIQEGFWKGPSIFLASAHMKQAIRETYQLPLWDALPSNHRAIFIHSTTDALVLYQDSVDTINNSKIRNGDQGILELWTARSPSIEKDPCGNHRLHEITKDGSLQRAIEQLTGLTIPENDEQTCRDLCTKKCDGCDRFNDLEIPVQDIEFSCIPSIS